MATKLVLIISLLWISHQKVEGSAGDWFETSVGIHYMVSAIAERFCSQVVCYQLTTSEHENCLRQIAEECRPETGSDSPNVPNDLDQSVGTRQRLNADCDVYEECVALSISRLHQPSDRPEQKTTEWRDVIDGMDKPWKTEDGNRQQEFLRPAKKWSERLPLYGKKSATKESSESPKRWSERLKIPSRKWSERLKIPGNTKRWSSRLILPQKKWYDEKQNSVAEQKMAELGIRQDEEKKWSERLHPLKRDVLLADEEEKKWSERLRPTKKDVLLADEEEKKWSERLRPSKRDDLLADEEKKWSERLRPTKKDVLLADEEEKKWSERLRPTKRHVLLRVRRSAVNESDENLDNDEGSNDDKIIGTTFGKRSDNVDLSDNVKKWADRIMHYNKKWGSRIRPFDKKWGGRIIPLAKKWVDRILPISTKRDAERPFIDYDNNIVSLTPSAVETDGAHSDRAKRWSERMYPHVLETRQSSARGSRAGGAMNRVLLRRTWPRSELLARNVPYLFWRKPSFGVW